jgi:hypothetical protein
MTGGYNFAANVDLKEICLSITGWGREFFTKQD